jgi:hypothetical protein
MTRMAYDDQGAVPLVEYIITFTIASILFTIVLVMANSMFIEGPQRTVSQVQFTDIGNDITAKIMDTYLIAPSPGSNVSAFEINTMFDMPLTVAGNSYMVNFTGGSTLNTDDREIYVYSDTNSVRVNLTLNGIHSTIPVDGNTSSASGTHWIYYQR